MKDEDKSKHARDFGTGLKDHPRVADWREDGLWIIILSMGGRNYCTYVGVPIEHPLSSHDYDDLPVDCHGGLTFAGAGDGEYRPEGYFWYGWDYGHSGDYSHYSGSSKMYPDDKDWTLEEVKNDAWRAIYDFGKLKRLTEKIYSDAKR